MWENLDAFLLTPFHKKDGTALYISAACIDSGYRSNQVYSFILTRLSVDGLRMYGTPCPPLPLMANT